MYKVLQIAQIIVSVALIITVLRQPGKADGFNLISSTSETFYAKNKTRTYESFLSRLTVFLSIAFAVITAFLTLLR